MTYESDTKKALHYMGFCHGHLINKNKLARVVFLVRDTSSWYEQAVCEVSWIYSILLMSYKPDTNFQHDMGIIPISK